MLEEERQEIDVIDIEEALADEGVQALH